MSLNKLLRHFAAYTNKKQNYLTYLLTLLKLYEPTPNYSLLPSTGKDLMTIDGSNWPDSSNEPFKKKLPVAVPINGGQFVHFGVENALNRTSAGLIYRDADLIQFFDVYQKEPHLLQKIWHDRVKELQNLIGIFKFVLILTHLCS
jgi:hypothetical protein